MDLKKKLKRFFTLTRKANDGFTLVELIVVIAILAILAGVGSVGYAGYIKSANKGNDKVLVGEVMQALETSAYSYMADFNVAGQYSDGLQIPVGFVVMSDEVLTGSNGETGYIVALSTDTANHPVGKSLEAAFGADYGMNYKLSYPEWETGAIGGSTLHNATAGMLGKITSTGDLMIALQDLIQLTNEKYDDSGDLIITVAGNIADYNGDGAVNAADKTAFVQKWMDESDTAYSSVGFGLGGRENYSAVRLGYNNSFAEYVRANYEGEKDADTLANGIANYGQSAGELAYDVAYDKAGGGIGGKIAGNVAKATANAAAPNATFPYTANAKAFDDPDYPGYNDEEVAKLYEEWLAGPAKQDAAMFYDTMVTAATDGAKYAEENGTDKFVDWFAAQAQAYSDNMNAVQDMVAGKSAIVVVAYYQNGLMDFEVYSTEADPRND